MTKIPEKNAEYLGIGCRTFTGTPLDYMKFTMEEQLCRTDLWEHFTGVFGEGADNADNGWRGEYFGKMMRGACLTYRATGDKELYSVLEKAVRMLLARQDSLGRFSTYDTEHEFCGWDMWSRKYVLTGLQHFYDICGDEELKKTIVTALCRHADYICERIGDGEGQKRITATSDFWLGVNSCSILEPFVRLFDMTGEKKYLDFAEYILSTGGIEGEESLIELALEDKKKPFEYPEVKAYETMSFFEGALAYYEVTGREKYLEAVLKFAEAVNDTDITVIGCAGCTHELFDNSAEKQTEYSDVIMQETCVTVTWMRLLARLYTLTGDMKYADRIERSALNALYGSVNVNRLCNEKSWKVSEFKGYFEYPVPFDSYSPLFNNRRGRGMGGHKRFADDTYYGCCACIGAAGTALYPLVSALTSKDGITVNYPIAGFLSYTLPSGKSACMKIESEYPKEASFRLILSEQSGEAYTVRVRVPSFLSGARVNAGTAEIPVKDGCAEITREWKNGDRITVTGKYVLSEEKRNGRTAFLYGPLVLARDSAKETCEIDFEKDTTVLRRCGRLCAAPQPTVGEEKARFAVETADGTGMLLTDYASCGKNWMGEKKSISVWMNIR